METMGAKPILLDTNVLLSATTPARSLHEPALRVDAEVLAWYRAQGDGWQTRMNAVLKAYKDASG